MLVFFFPVDGPGGVQSLIINISKWANIKNEYVKIIDKDDGYVKNQLDNENIIYKYININNSNLSEHITKDDVFITTGYNIHIDYFKLYKTKCKIIFWQVFPTTPVDIFRLRLIFQKKEYSERNIVTKFLIKNFVKIFLAHNAYLIMESSSTLFNPRIFFKSPILMPIPIIIDNHIDKTNRKKTISNLCYIGRFENWKNTSLLRILDDINKHNNNKENKLLLTVVTNNIKKTKKLIFDHQLNDSNVNYYENLTKETLKTLLKNNIDAVFAMGTSLLDSASLGIPSVIASASYKEILEDKYYVLLNETYGANLAFPNFIFKENQGKYNFEEVLKKINSFDAGMACYNYVKENHSMDIIYERLMMVCKESNLNIHKLHVMRYYFYFKIMCSNLFRRIIKKMKSR